ncbi:hypothetical protein WN48_04600 [Eufriesea mexicana]|nr:hypothetical protein WN48_04600 [Eufriesea mexicana]
MVIVWDGLAILTSPLDRRTGLSIPPRRGGTTGPTLFGQDSVWDKVPDRVFKKFQRNFNSDNFRWKLPIVELGIKKGRKPVNVRNKAFDRADGPFKAFPRLKLTPWSELENRSSPRREWADNE